MTCVFVTSDWHLGHKNIAKFRTQVESVEENTQILVENYLSVVTKRDVVWFLGDMAFDLESLHIIKELPGDKRLVLGNHDTDRGQPLEQIVLTYDKVCGLVNYKHAWLSHAPIHPDELRGKVNIHGHTHNFHVNDDRYFNVCVDQTDMKPLKFQDVMASIKSRGNE